MTFGIKQSFLLFCLPTFFAASVCAQDKLYPNAFPLSDIRLLDGPLKHAQDLNLTVLLKYNPENMLAPFRKVGGLPSKAKNYPNWESDGLDGHIGGHYLSAMAIHYASTGNTECLARLEYMISELKECQETNAKKFPDWGVGYLGGVPNSNILWPEIKKGNISVIWQYWVPWYNIHKTYTGLRDAWLYTGNNEAKNMFLQFCDWAINLTSALSDSQMEDMLNNEHGGMNEIFADAYQMTGENKYLAAARRFSHKALLTPLANGTDNLDNKHANTQIPKVVGFQRVSELSGDSEYASASRFFWETVTQNRSLALGGNSRKEHFPSAHACSDYINDVEGPESCNSYNMLKLTEDLFRTEQLVKYVDFYERTLFNHILSTQHPQHGGYVYFTPVRPRHYRVYSAPEKAMWCCVGTGMENHGKYGQFIYSHNSDSLFINLFVASELNWKAKGIQIKQENNYPVTEFTNLTITKGTSEFTLLIRYPSWVKEGKLKIAVNGKPININTNPGNYITINRKWKAGDKVYVEFPMKNSIEHLPNVPEYIAFMHGPVLLAASTGTEDLTGLIANDSRWGHIAGGKMLPVDQAPIIIDNNIEKLADKVILSNPKEYSFSLTDAKLIHANQIKLEPFYRIHDSRYSIYWMALSENQYGSYLDSVARIEKEKLEMESRTLDWVTPGEQQPESDHKIQSTNSRTGTHMDKFWREANNEGYFSYLLSTNKETEISLLVRYWGYEWGNREFDIYIDDNKLISENNTGKWYESKFIDVEYSIPASLVEGKSKIRVKFQALPGSTAGAVYFVRLVKNN